ncbi:MAG TPA: Flp pilus assembly protein CpaB [Actinomycetota bacterium]|nr:Flp pilus assembly protein CpaB [Actinomycetota bacterium]
MRRRRWRSSRTYFMGSVALSLTAGLLLRTYVTRAATVASAAAPEVEVVEASKRIERGASLASSDLRLARMPVAYAPPGALIDVSRAAGRVALADLSPGEVVTETRLARVRAGPVASLVPRGLRAFAVPTSLPLGLVAPGDRVDVLATFNAGQAHTEIVVSGVEVLFVLGSSGAGHAGSNTSDGAGGFDSEASEAGLNGSTTLVLLVSPDQQERLAFARAFANLEVTMAPAE